MTEYKGFYYVAARVGISGEWAATADPAEGSDSAPINTRRFSGKGAKAKAETEIKRLIDIRVNKQETERAE